MKWNKAACGLMILIFLGGFTSVASADDFDGQYDNAYIKSRTYIGGFGTSVDIDANNAFNGSNSFSMAPVTVQVYPPAPPSTTPVTIWSFLEIDLVPAINRNFGFGTLVGHREGAYAIEVSYWQSNHSASWAGGWTSTSIYSTLNLDLKRYFFVTIPVQPFVDIGLNFPWLTTKNASANFDVNQATVPLVSIDDSHISGIGLNLGIGLEVYLSDEISLVGSAIQRFTSWDQVNGANKVAGDHIYFNGNYNVGPYGNFEGNGLNFYVGTTFAFQGI